jgi:hypothetical protein
MQQAPHNSVGVQEQDAAKFSRGARSITGEFCNEQELNSEEN